MTEDTSLNPDYASLKCPKCGNTRFFREVAQRETDQPFTLKNGVPDYDGPFDFLDSNPMVLEIRCGAEEKGDALGGSRCNFILRSYQTTNAGGEVGTKD